MTICLLNVCCRRFLWPRKRLCDAGFYGPVHRPPKKPASLSLQPPLPRDSQTSSILILLLLYLLLLFLILPIYIRLLFLLFISHIFIAPLNSRQLFRGVILIPLTPLHFPIQKAS